MPAVTAAADIVIRRTAAQAVIRVLPAIRVHPPVIPVPQGAQVLPAIVRAQEAVPANQAVRVTAPVREAAQAARAVRATVLVPAAVRAGLVAPATLTVQETVPATPAVRATVPRRAAAVTTSAQAAEKVTVPARLQMTAVGEVIVPARATVRVPVSLRVPRNARTPPAPTTQVRLQITSPSTVRPLARARRKRAKTPSRATTNRKSRQSSRTIRQQRLR